MIIKALGSSAELNMCIQTKVSDIVKPFKTLLMTKSRKLQINYRSINDDIYLGMGE